ncbi:MAG: lipocalin family protein [Longimicrobiales bacterium]
MRTLLGRRSPVAILLTIPCLLLLLSSCGDATGPEAEQVIHAYYSEDYSLYHSVGPQQLSDFMTGAHLDYHQYGWNVGASLEDASGVMMGFFIAIEYSAADPEHYRGGVGFSRTEEGGYKWMGFTNTSYQTTTSPWSATLESSQMPGSSVTIELASGLMGSGNAVYRLKGSVIDVEGKSLVVDVRLRDRFGAINQGYGTTSYFPHYIKQEQRAGILALPERTVGAYLASTTDRMRWQGAYYYALPMMDVEQFTVVYDGTTYTGTGGKGWMDYFVKSYNEESITLQDGSAWNWIAIQLPDIGAAINVLDIRNPNTGAVPFARLFNLNSARTRNGARNAVHSWAIDEITVTPMGETWTTPTGVTYAMQYRIQLESATYPGDLTVTLIRKNQAVVLPEGSNYQGLGLVTGVLGGQAVNGRCWVEVQPG